MNHVMAYILLVCGCWNIFAALTCNTSGMKAAAFFKVIPFFTGCAACMCAMDMLGWVSIFA